MSEINIQTELSEIRKELKELKVEVSQYKSFVGGVLWTFMALSAALAFVFEWAKELIK